ncbi:MAG TPA: hypothetical protein PKB11_06640 [Desulfovibrio sp.]|uniref:hypothetical protein n=1 Tax=Desulfovibrio sp. TaxID=885 RepID=UPI002BB105DE|nr:hypothetical protein [Desulfovibrio sp.]HMM38420.1 hypothetical protein [Desulfovibrio sp.]
MNHLKYSVLFMRDDSDVRRFRISPFWLKAFLYFQGFLLLLSIIGISIGATFWSTNASLRADRKALELRLSEAEVQLERLSNIEKMKAEASAKGAAPAEKSGAAPAEPPAPKTPPVSLRDLFARMNTAQVTVENFQARINGNEATVSFELTNVQSANTLSGLAELTLIRNDGQVLGVEANRADLSFQIQRFKHIRTVFTLPKGADRRDVFGLRLEIKGSDGKTIFSDTFPLRDVAS